MLTYCFLKTDLGTELYLRRGKLKDENAASLVPFPFQGGKKPLSYCMLMETQQCQVELFWGQPDLASACRWDVAALT